MVTYVSGENITTLDDWSLEEIGKVCFVSSYSGRQRAIVAKNIRVSEKNKEFVGKSCLKRY